MWEGSTRMICGDLCQVRWIMYQYLALTGSGLTAVTFFQQVIVLRGRTCEFSIRRVRFRVSEHRNVRGADGIPAGYGTRVGGNASPTHVRALDAWYFED
jgi:hypothetical protein